MSYCIVSKFYLFICANQSRINCKEQEYKPTFMEPTGGRKRTKFKFIWKTFMKANFIANKIE
jgi:hypothetical protein